MNKKLVKQMGMMGIAVGGVIALSVPLATSLVACSSEASSKTNPFPSSESMAAETATISDPKEAMTYVNQLFSQHYSLDDFKTDLKDTITKTFASTLEDGTCRFQLTDVQANPNKSVNFKIHTECDDKEAEFADTD